MREKNLPTDSLDPSYILIEYGFEADYNFHEKSETAWLASAALCFCGGTASWSW